MIANDVRYGLSSAITPDLATCFRYAAQAETGLPHVNQLTIYLRRTCPFGGMMESASAGARWGRPRSILHRVADHTCTTAGAPAPILLGVGHGYYEAVFTGLIEESACFACFVLRARDRGYLRPSCSPGRARCTDPPHGHPASTLCRRQPQHLAVTTGGCRAPGKRPQLSGPCGWAIA
jgi:hypothetical protein